ncbi:hypothetical protein ABEB36_003929 [Hypothenemus hampei]
MLINPINIINLLLLTFKSQNLPNTPTTEKERAIAKEVEDIITRTSNDVSWEFETHDTLEFDDPLEEHEAIIIEDEEEVQRYLGDSDFTPQPLCAPGNEPLSFEYKKKAVEFWKSGKTGNLKLSTVRARFKKVQSIMQLTRWENAINQGGTYKEKLAKISQFSLDRFMEAVERRLPVHNIAIRRWALQANRDVKLDSF